MILRRLVTALRRQDYVTVLIETLIVVLGVFLGIQLGNWNEARQTDRLEREYLERLFVDANATIEDFNALSNWEQARMTQLHTVIEALRRGSFTSAEREAIETGVALFGLVNTVAPRWGTVEELQSTGNITLIDDIELRRLIADAEFSYDRSLGVTQPRVAQLIALRTDVMRRVDLQSFNHFGRAPDAEIAFDFEALAADADFIALLSEGLFAQDLVYTFAAGNTRRVEAMRDHLAASLGKETTGLPTTRDLTQSWPWRVDPEPREP